MNDDMINSEETQEGTVVLNVLRQKFREVALRENDLRRRVADARSETITTRYGPSYSSLSLSLSLSLSHSLTHSHTHTHAQSTVQTNPFLTHPPTHTHTHTLSYCGHSTWSLTSYAQDDP